MGMFFNSKTELDLLAIQLKLLSIDKVHIEFQGGGDEGHIEGIFGERADGTLIDVPKDIIAWTLQAYGADESVQSEVTIKAALEDIGLRVLDETGMDWYNDGGGQGEVILDLTGEKLGVKVNLDINITSTEEHEFEYLEEEDGNDVFYPHTAT